MQINSYLKNLMHLLFALVFLNSTPLHSEILNFKAGEQVSYTISQREMLEVSFSDEDDVDYRHTDDAIDLDIKIKSLNQETLSYPFDVEVILKKVKISYQEQVEQEVEFGEYNSSSNVKTLENYMLAAYFEQLIDHPLIFRVTSDFQVKETSGYLAQLYSNSSIEISGLFGATPWTYELLLTQLFHLAGENLELSNSCPASCYQFLNWEEEKPMNPKKTTITQSCEYTVTHLDNEEIEASWQGNAETINSKNDVLGNVSVKGNVTWNSANPLIQKRVMEVQIEETELFWLTNLVTRLKVQQTWTPITK